MVETRWDLLKDSILVGSLINWNTYTKKIDTYFATPFDCSSNRLIHLSCPENFYSLALIKGPERVETNAGITRIN